MHALAGWRWEHASGFISAEARWAEKNSNNVLLVTAIFLQMLSSFCCTTINTEQTNQFNFTD